MSWILLISLCRGTVNPDTLEFKSKHRDVWAGTLCDDGAFQPKAFKTKAEALQYASAHALALQPEEGFEAILIEAKDVRRVKRLVAVSIVDEPLKKEPTK